MCLHFNKIKKPVICHVVSSTELWISPVSFHEYIRGGALSKWLDVNNDTSVCGSARVQNLAGTLCPSLQCQWLPSERMAFAVRKRKHNDITSATGLGAASATNTKSSTAVEILATPAWLVVYTLLVNCDTTRQRPERCKKRRVRAFHVLTELVELACEVGVKNTSQAEIETGHTTLSCTSLGHLQFDQKWCQVEASERISQLRDMLHQHGQEENERSELGLVNLETVAGMLWHVSRICMRRCRTKADFHNRRVAIDISHNIIMFLTQGLQCWFGQAKEASTVQLLSCQPGRRRTGPLLVHNLMQKNRPRAQARAWREDGLRILPAAGHLERRTSTQYLVKTHETLGKQRVVELCMDASVRSRKEFNVTIAYAPVLNMSAYLPPLLVRTMHWRDGYAGSELLQTDVVQFLKTGFRAKPRMAIWDSVRELEHILKGGLGKSLADFQLPEKCISCHPGV